ncbi:hypothetical protein V1511DRAFT_496354 [Dipodascopsis uninucleata]
MSLYTTTLLIVNPDIYAPLKRTYKRVMTQALHYTIPHGFLDILVIRPPQTFRDTHDLVVQLYMIAAEAAVSQAREEVDVKVILHGVGGFRISDAGHRNWEVVCLGKIDMKILPTFVQEQQSSQFSSALPIIILPMGDLGSSSTTSSVTGDLEEENEELNSGINIGEAGLIVETEDGTNNSLLEQEAEGLEASYPVVAVGGTFDHLHAGHKILLTMSGFLTSKILEIGVTGPELLKNKKYAEYLEPLEVRMRRVKEFLGYIYPYLSVTTREINDIFGQSVTIEDIDALIVSAETRSGAKLVNEERQKRSFHPLKVWQIGLISGDPTEQLSEKLSSTDIRRNLYENDLHQKNTSEEAECR